MKQNNFVCVCGGGAAQGGYNIILFISVVLEEEVNSGGKISCP